MEIHLAFTFYNGYVRQFLCRDVKRQLKHPFRYCNYLFPKVVEKLTRCRRLTGLVADDFGKDTGIALVNEGLLCFKIGWTRAGD